MPEAGAYLRLIYSCITQLKAQGPSRTCNEIKEEGCRARVWRDADLQPLIERAAGADTIAVPRRARI